MKSSILIILAALFITTRLSPAGVAAAIDSELIKNVKNYVVPAILKDINAIKIGRIDFDKGHVDNIEINLANQDQDSVQVLLSKANNGIQFKLQDIQGYIKGEFHYKVLFFTARGNFKVRFDTGGATLGVDLPLHSQNVNGRSLPKIDVDDFLMRFDSSKIHIDLSGTFLADIASPFTWFFKSTIIKSIQNSINSSVPSALSTSLQNAIVASNGYAPIENGLMIDYQFPVDPVVTDTQLGVFLNATLFNSSIGYKTPFTNISDIQINMTETNAILLDAGRYSADSLLMVIHDSGLFTQTFSQADNSTLSQYLTTTYLDGFLPGLVAKYGKDQPVTVNLYTKYAPNAFFNVDEMGANITADIQFIVNNETALIIELVDADAFIIPQLNNFTFKIQVETINIRDITQSQSQIGDLNLFELKTFLNVMFRIGIPVINTFLQTGFTIPNEFFGVFIIENAEFHSNDGYVSIIFSPQFVQ